MVSGRLLLGASLRSRRVEAGLQLADVAERAGITQSYLSLIERGNRLPPLPVLDSLAVALGTVASELLTGVYPWGTTHAPADLPQRAPDGRGREYRQDGSTSD